MRNRSGTHVSNDIRVVGKLSTEGPGGSGKGVVGGGKDGHLAGHQRVGSDCRHDTRLHRHSR